MTDFILKSNKEVTAFLEENEPPPQPESWICPNCGATNYSLFFSRSTKCAECKQYTHPPLEKNDTKTQIRTRNTYLSFINSEISRHQNEIDDLINEINDIKEEQHSLEIERQDVINEIKKIKEQEEKIMSEDTEKIELECPICKHKQLVNLDTYMMFLFMGGHPYTCPTETCPSHTELIPTNQCLKEIRNLQIQNEKK